MQFVINAIDRDTAVHRARAMYGKKLLTMMTTRSHDQYNTTIFGLDDRYRGVFGRRRVVFINKKDLKMLASKTATVSISPACGTMVLSGAQTTSCWGNTTFPCGCVSSYYHETNPLVPLANVSVGAGTPTFKSIPVLLHPAKGANQA